MAIPDRERARVEHLLEAKQIGLMPEGPRLERFNPLELAEALEQQATRARLLYDVPKIDMRMDVEDALALAAWLRQAPGPGPR
jgi:CheY-like chemotaxis protein